MIESFFKSRADRHYSVALAEIELLRQVKHDYLEDVNHLLKVPGILSMCGWNILLYGFDYLIYLSIKSVENKN